LTDSASANLLSNPRKFGLRVLLMATLWMGLTGFEWQSWLIGLPIVVISAWLSLRLADEYDLKWSPAAILPFAWYFTLQSIRGGWDVALRAFSWNVRLNPGIVAYTLRLPPGPSQLFFCAIVSLLPGTLVVSLSESKASIHVLDLSADHQKELAEMERQILRLFVLKGTPDSENM
jgi:multicomponent Na+:H+ antiporter subunit E